MGVVATKRSAIAGDAVATEIEGHGARETDESGLGGDIRGAVATAGVDGRGADVDHPPPALRGHERIDRLGEEPGGLEVDVEVGVPHRRVELVERHVDALARELPQRHGSVVDQDVHLAEVRAGRGDCGLHRRLVGHVAAVPEHRPAALALQRLSRLLQHRFGGAADGKLGAVAVKPLADRAPDAASAARNQCHMAFQSVCHDVSPLLQ
jgi:hypothetical protein